MEVEIVVQLGKLQHDLDRLWLVGSGEAPMLLALENSIAALEDEVRADGILRPVQALVPVLLLGQQDYCSELFGLPWHC